MNQDDLVDDLKEVASIGRAGNMRNQLKSVIQDIQEGEYESGSDQE